MAVGAGKADPLFPKITITWRDTVKQTTRRSAKRTTPKCWHVHRFPEKGERIPCRRKLLMISRKGAALIVGGAGLLTLGSPVIAALWVTSLLPSSDSVPVYTPYPRTFGICSINNPSVSTVPTVPSLLTAGVLIPLHHARYLQAFDPCASANPCAMFLIAGCSCGFAARTIFRVLYGKCPLPIFYTTYESRQTLQVPACFLV